MNLWTFISTILLSIGFAGSSLYHLPSFELVSNADGQKINVSDEVFDDSGKIIPHKKFNQSLGVKISAQAAAVMDKNTGTILWQKNANEARSIASISKLMTALVFLDNNPGWNTEITMAIEDEAEAGTDHILRGETVIVKDLFYTGLIASDNNSIKALVRSTGLSEEDFVYQMNQKAVSFGLENTSFVEPTGLSEKNQSTALEVLQLAKYAFAKSDIADAVSRDTYSFWAISGQNHKIHSTNKLLNSYLDIIAGKTGYIGASGYCLVSEVVGDDNQHILSVVLGSDSHEGRFYDLKVLSGWVLENYSWF